MSSAARVTTPETALFKKPLGVASKKVLKPKSRAGKTQQPAFSPQQKERIIKHLLQQSLPPSFLPASVLTAIAPSTLTTASSSSSASSLSLLSSSSALLPRRVSFVNFVEMSSCDPVSSISEEIDCRSNQMQELTNTIYFATLQYYCDFLAHLRNRLHVFATMAKANALLFDSPTNTLTQFCEESLALIPSSHAQAKHLAISFVDSTFAPLSEYIHATIRASVSSAANSILQRLVSDAASVLLSSPPSPSSPSSVGPMSDTMTRPASE